MKLHDEVVWTYQMELDLGSDARDRPRAHIDDLYDFNCTNCDRGIQRGKMFYMNKHVDENGKSKHIGHFCCVPCWEEFINDLQ